MLRMQWSWAFEEEVFELFERIAFMEITSVDSKDELSDMVEELGVHFEVEEDEVLDDEDVYLNEGYKNLQDVYNALLEDCGKYAKVAKSVVNKMKKIKE